jgi:hypothetical protein
MGGFLRKPKLLLWTYTIRTASAQIHQQQLLLQGYINTAAFASIIPAAAVAANILFSPAADSIPA